jgi:hypothetical protein
VIKAGVAWSDPLQLDHRESDLSRVLGQWQGVTPCADSKLTQVFYFFGLVFRQEYF